MAIVGNQLTSANGRAGSAEREGTSSEGVATSPAPMVGQARSTLSSGHPAGLKRSGGVSLGYANCMSSTNLRQSLQSGSYPLPYFRTAPFPGSSADTQIFPGL